MALAVLIFIEGFGYKFKQWTPCVEALEYNITQPTAVNSFWLSHSKIVGWKKVPIWNNYESDPQILEIFVIHLWNSKLSSKATDVSKITRAD